MKSLLLTKAEPLSNRLPVADFVLGSDYSGGVAIRAVSESSKPFVVDINLQVDGKDEHYQLFDQLHERRRVCTQDFNKQTSIKLYLREGDNVEIFFAR